MGLVALQLDLQQEHRRLPQALHFAIMVQNAVVRRPLDVFASYIDPGVLGHDTGAGCG